MNNFSHFYKKKTPSQKKLHDDILKEIHSKLVIAERKMEDIWNKHTFYKNVREILNMNGIDISDGYFFPKHIQNDIKTNLIGEVSYRCKIFEREVSFSFYIMENELFNNIDKIDAIAKKMIMWLAFILPITKMFGTNTIYFEKYPNSKINYDDYLNVELNDNELGSYYFNKCYHYNRINKTGKSRISLDFRIIPFSKYNNSVKLSETYKTKLVIGDYFIKL